MIEELTGIPVIAKVKDGDGELAIDIEKLKKIYNYGKKGTLLW